MKNLKLNALASESLSKVEMNHVRGGSNERCCSCSCAYANSGGSSTGSNASANYKIGDGGHSITGSNSTTVCISFE